MLGVIGEIVVQVLSKGELDKKSKETRDQLLDTLEVSGSWITILIILS